MALVAKSYKKEVFAERVKILRLKKNIKQSDLGRIIGLSDKAVSDIERCYRLTTMLLLYNLILQHIEINPLDCNFKISSPGHEKPK